MTLTEKVTLGLVAGLMVFGIYHDVNAGHTDPRAPEQMLLQPMLELPGFSKLCTMPLQLLDPDSGTWSNPIMRCVFIETPGLYDPKRHMVCDAVGPGEDYIDCGVDIGA